MLANECVAVLETFGLNFGISSSVLGITVLAWGNSVGDLVADTALVKQGKTKMAVAGVFGSPLLSDLLGLGVSFTSYNLARGPLHATLSLQNKVAAAFIVVSMLTTIIGFCLFRFRCPRRLGWVLVIQYCVFMVVSVMQETGWLYHVDHSHHSLAPAGGDLEPAGNSTGS
jgi:sodium/potassium/calcium exchanger 6